MKIHIMKAMCFRVEVGYLTLLRELVSLFKENSPRPFRHVFTGESVLQHKATPDAT
jgi:hypothetical protein